MNRQLKTVMLFFVGGLISGISAAILSTRFLSVLLVGIGPLFLAALIVCWVIARNRKFFTFTASPLRYALAALIVFISYPLAVIALLFGGQIGERIISQLTDVEPRAAFFLPGLIGASLVASLLVWLALRIITRRADWTALRLLLLAGVAVAILAWAAPAIVGAAEKGEVDVVFLATVFPLGMSLFGAICGYSASRLGSSLPAGG